MIYSRCQELCEYVMPVKQYKEIELLTALAKLAARERKALGDLIFEAIYEYLEARGALPPQYPMTLRDLARTRIPTGAK